MFNFARSIALTTEAATTGAQTSSLESILGLVVPLALMFGLMWLLLIRDRKSVV